MPRRRRLFGRRRSARAPWLALLLLPLILYAAAGVFAPERVLTQALRLDAWRSDTQRVEREVRGESWVWLQRGELDPARPVWLFVHGFTGSKENWLPLLRELPSDLQILAPDLPGWGESGRRADAGYGYAAQAARLAGLIEVLDLQQVHLVGHSMGGGIVALTAARYPQRACATGTMPSGWRCCAENIRSRWTAWTASTPIWAWCSVSHLCCRGR
jgi:pimeloyl-ACP methyl ester carboxylesterase